MHKTANSLSKRVRSGMVDLLNARLADLLDLYSHTKQAHWNVKGPVFIALHEMFDAAAEEVEELIDEVAERCVALGGEALGTARVVARASSLKEYPKGIANGAEHLAALVERFAHVASAVREAIDTADRAGDPATADLFTQGVRALDKKLWMLESHLRTAR